MKCDLGSRPGADPSLQRDQINRRCSMLSLVPFCLQFLMWKECPTGGMAALVKQSRALWKAETYVRATKCLVHCAQCLIKIRHTELITAKW